ncbi:BZ3500_MvSof-1268-A1-R1_Chr2-2g04994 [Microbotryum saponariae]|uniref:BZ3500_MvSof-1268-A1-R1_Chr2-2g04994 protein n=1 Tax=Microbotryum saponariae TaxID=289078 RepID=A0A2X0K8F6_9BASI|nr:BZ3500_MvSof-1268-A1-R1_Chr2-2g04994 [Microbotryum saponariae]SDA00662.1 BZ3501_MvSof-1269-A2-R1_Chr2-2g04668 [Microbotryum saponariae]
MQYKYKSRRSLGVDASTRVTLTRLGVVGEQFTPILRAHPSSTVWTVGPAGAIPSI